MSSERYKVFQDATLGYISVEDIYVENLIDSFYMQREKNVSQVGLHPIFSGATHNRFAHSLGVYHIGTKIFQSVKQSTSRLNTHIDMDVHLEIYGILYEIACLLHDIGHTAFSHTLEYNFNDKYVDLDIGGETRSVGLKRAVAKLLDRYLELKKSAPSDTYLNCALQKKFKVLERKNMGLAVRSSPHETMGAYQILTSKVIRKSIENILTAKCNNSLLQNKWPIISDCMDNWLAFIARMITGCKYDIQLVTQKSGARKYVELKERYSLRNCIISLLNGNIDADMLDYLNRNSHYAGYASNNIDLNRLCSAFQIHYDIKKNLFSNCIYKSALSSLDGVIQARNFEPKWLYSHHKVVYFNDVLLKFLIKESSARFCKDYQKDIEQVLLESLFAKPAKYKKLVDPNQAQYIFNYYTAYTDNSVIITHASGNLSALRNRIASKLTRIGAFPAVKNPRYLKLKGKLADFAYFAFSHIGVQLKQFPQNASEIKDEFDALDRFIAIVDHLAVAEFKYAFINIMLAPNTRMRRKETFFVPTSFNKTTDADLENLFKNLYIMVKPSDNVNAHPKDTRDRLYIELLEEFRTRKYRQSLWKSFEEYQLFIESVIADIPSLSFSQASEWLIRLIENQRDDHWIEFEDTQKSIIAAKNNRYRDTESIYVNDHDGQLFDRIFGFLGDSMIIRLYHGKYKSFDNVLVKFSDTQFKEYKKLQNSPTPKEFYFPYIYFKPESKNYKEERNNKLKILAAKLNLYLKLNCGEGQNMDIENISALDRKIIRDSVHGDIEVKNKYMAIVRCKAFQRMHRIKQLATANYVFPEAVHTRFAHSLGTFHVMTKMVNHFCSLFDTLNIKYTERDKDVILVAALLHDIGHGPLSHTFEGLAGIQSHEDWTSLIIENDEELNGVLRKYWGDSFPNEVIDCLKKNTTDTHSLKYVFSELISSNLDADRIDYLLRDSQNTGEKFGVFDMQKLISSMVLTEYDGKLCVALSHNALPAVEQFIVGRYNMYSMVYFAPYKLMSEELFRIICKSIVQQADICLNSVNKVIREIGVKLSETTVYKLSKGQVGVKEYLRMDDYTIMHEITQSIEELSKLHFGKKYKYMLDSFLYRNGYERKHILNDSIVNFDTLTKRLANECYYSKLQYSVIKVQTSFCAYKREIGVRDKEILIVYDNGEIKPFSKASKYKSDFSQDQYDLNKGNDLWRTSFAALYLNLDILDIELRELGASNPVKAGNRLVEILDSYDMNKHTEIENKYFCNSVVFKKAETKIKDLEKQSEYTIGNKKTKEQYDTYYDTETFDLAKHGYTFRCRNVGDKKIFTLKKPGAIGNGADEAQFIRLEFEIEADSDEITSDTVVQFLKDNNLIEEMRVFGANITDDFSTLKKIVCIKNNRTCYIVRHKNISEFVCEVAFDDISYTACNEDGGKALREYQIEMELKCSHIYRITLNDFAKKLCALLEINEQENKATQSKYIHALKGLNLL